MKVTDTKDNRIPPTQSSKNFFEDRKETFFSHNKNDGSHFFTYNTAQKRTNDKQFLTNQGLTANGNPVSGVNKTSNNSLVQAKKKPLSGFSKPREIFLPNDTKTEKKVYEAIKQSPIIGPFIKDKIKAGVKIQGSVKYHYKRDSFEESYSDIGNRDDDIKSIGGFYDRKNKKIHLPPSPRIESLVHESIHKFSHNFLGFTTFIHEGLTQLFTNTVLVENGLSKGSTYKKELKVAEAIRDKVGGLKNLSSLFFAGGPKKLRDALFKNPKSDFGGFIQLARKKDTKKLIEYLKNH
ncbi:hypothetical protein [uncultured Psychroserpens sp.]|uniref:hypothetical protein n=1 Tax=uncultured Psychroserpens sp. TaxID=255436 RepID=UPI00261FD1C1|nr:hypothetical protein [uncultured Psychroserpens sp.]